MSLSHANELASLDQVIREGRIDVARTGIQRLRVSELARSETARVALLAVRAQIPEAGLRLLKGLVRPAARDVASATDEERAVYAECLTRIGASEEALELLKTVSHEKYPEAAAFRASAHISRFELSEAIPFLSQYLAVPSICSYRRLVAMLNLSAAMIFDRRFFEAKALLDELLAEASARSLHRIHGNALELLAQCFIEQKALGEAELCLDRAARFLADVGDLDSFYVRKWKAILGLLRSPKAASAQTELLEVTQEAFRRRHWETVRQCDAFRAELFGADRLFVHVYFGTPYASIRARLLETVGVGRELPEAYLWGIGREASEGLDIYSEELSRLGGSMPKTGVLHRLMRVLSSDFYRPFRIAGLHSALFPNEHFNPESSASRVHRAVKRLRGWLKQNGCPLGVAHEAGFYRLVGRGTGGVWTRVQSPSGGDRYATMLSRLKQTWPDRPFTSREAGRTLGVNPRTVHRLLADPVRLGQIVRVGQSRAIHYRFPH